MPITQADIVRIEREWRVEIEKLPNGNYEVISDRTDQFGEKIATALDTQYKIQVQPIDETITINPDYAKALGVELTGDLATDFANLNRVSFEGADGAADFHSNHAEFAGSHLHRSACVSAWLRSDGQVPPESWHANPAFGGAGAGASIEPGGGQGGVVSTIGPAHDTDWTLGAAGNVGPMKALSVATSITGKLPSGMHGIPNVANKLGSNFAEKEFQIYQNERASMPQTKGIPGYDSPTRSGPGWNVERIRHSMDYTKLTMETDNHSHEAGDALAKMGEYLDNGGDPELARAAFEATEDGKSIPENVQLALDQEQVAHQTNLDNSNIYTQDATEDDYSIV